MNRLDTVRPILTNQRRTSYMAGTTDKLQVKLEIYKKNRLVYQELPFEFWLNVPSGVWTKIGDFNTTGYGNSVFFHSCQTLTDINCCLGYARVYIDEIPYDSNLVRFNFLTRVEPTDLKYEIDAKYNDIDRSAYDIFNGMGRDNTFDRMWGT